MSEILKKSAFLQSIEDGANLLIWHSLFGYPQVINREGWDLINSFIYPREIHKFLKEANFDNAEESIRELRKQFFLIPHDFDERKFLARKNAKHEASLKNGNQINYLSLIICEACNFSCTYCISNSMIEASSRRDSKSKYMSFDSAKKAIDIFFSLQDLNDNRETYINFGGGEPLLNWKVVKRIFRYCKQEYFERFNVIFTINTNASLMTKEIAEELKKYDVKIALSLDGLGNGNDAVRIDRTGKSAFKRIIGSMDILDSIDNGVNGFSATLADKNFHLTNSDLIDFCVRRGFNDIRIDLDVVHMLSIPVDSAVSKLLDLKRQAESSGVHLTGFWERPAENLNSSILEKHIAFCGGVAGKSMCVSPSEEVFICGYSTHKYASLALDEIMESTGYKKIVKSRLVGEIARCKGCLIEGQCIGGCHIAEEYDSMNDNAALTYNCKLYKIMTVELLKDSLKECIDSP